MTPEEILKSKIELQCALEKCFPNNQSQILAEFMIKISARIAEQEERIKKLEQAQENQNNANR
jgi:hypothetical protein